MAARSPRPRAATEFFRVTVIVKQQDVAMMQVKDRRTPAGLETYVTLSGSLSEPRNGVSTAQVQFSEESTPVDDFSRSLGALIQTRPHLLFSVGVPTAAMSRLVALASSNRIYQVGLACQPTGRGKALVRSWSIATSPED